MKIYQAALFCVRLPHDGIESSAGLLRLLGKSSADIRTAINSESSSPSTCAATALLTNSSTTSVATAALVYCKLKVSCIVRSEIQRYMQRMSTAHNYYDAFRNLQNERFFSLCCFTCDAIKL